MVSVIRSHRKVRSRRLAGFQRGLEAGRNEGLLPFIPTRALAVLRCRSQEVGVERVRSGLGGNNTVVGVGGRSLSGHVGETQGIPGSGSGTYNQMPCLPGH